MAADEQMVGSGGHPLFEHGVCKWPGCEEHVDELGTFIG